MARTTLSVGLAYYDGAVQAWVFDLPGCVTGGRDPGEARARLRLVIEEHVGWLHHHGVAPLPWARWHVTEEVDASACAAQGGEFCFEADRVPLSADELARGIERMAFARADLLAAVAGVPDAVLDWQPELASMSTVDAWAPEARTIRGIVEHVLQLEVYYRTSLRDGVGEGIFSRVSDAASERRRTVDALTALSDGDRSRVFHPVRQSRATPEDWTARKLIRRIISHERAHAAEILQRRTWVLLGEPRLTPSPGA